MTERSERPRRSGWTGDWLSGPGGPGEPEAPQDWRGQRLGLPVDGPGSVPGFGRRLAAIAVDWVPCAIAAQVFTTNPGWSALMLFAALTVAGITLFGRTPGHAALGIRPVPFDGTRPPLPAVTRPPLLSVLIRTALLCLAVPPLLLDGDGRGLHDRVARTIMLRTR
ncbi:MAG TPA: hypothetical protein VGD67_02130 [Pseudonocardiaceae bacterium]